MKFPLKRRIQPADVIHMHDYALKTCALLLLILATTSVARTQNNADAGAKSKILALEHAWNQAESAKDIKALDSIFDDALVYVDLDGALLSKAQFLTRVKSAHLLQVTTQSMTVEHFDDTAVVTGTYQATELKEGKQIVRRGRFVDTWIFRNSNWICIAAQSTPIAH
jgi:ketosteroid isomerase-like protein